MADEVLQAPLVEIEGSSAPVATFGLQQPLLRAPPTALNMAEHLLIKQQVDDYLVNLLDATRRERTTMEEEWRAIRRMEMMVHDGGRRYYGRHDSYLPLWARAKKSLVSNLSRGLFPSDEYMDVQDRASLDPERAKPVKSLIQWEFETNANVRGNIKPGLGEYASFGNFVMKHWYKKQPRTEGQSVKLGPFGGTGLAFGTAIREGFAVSARSVFHVYVWPTTAATLDEAVVLFEDIDVPRTEIEKLINAGKFANGNAALEAPEPDVHMSQMAEQHQNLHGMSPPQQSMLNGNRLGQVRTLTEVWTSMFLPREALLPNEDPNTRYAVRLVMAGNVCVEARRNPCLHQRPPYEYLSANTQPGMFYGYGEGRLARPTQLLANDFFNQGSDIGEYVLNPILMANPAVMVGQMLPIAPGRIYQTLDVANGMKFDRPPVEMIEYAQMMVNVLMGMNQDQSGAPAQSQGLQGGKSAKTATQAQLLQRNAMTPLQDQVEDIEIGVMIPMMRACWQYAQQWRKQQVIAMVAGQPIVVDPADLVIDPHFRWLASSQAINQAQRAQNAMLLLQAIGPLIPYLNQIGYLVDPAILLNRIFSDGFGFRGFSDFIKKVAPTPMGMPGMPGQMPPGMAEQQGAAMDRARSTLEQVTGRMDASDAAPGEAEEFMEVRQGADQMAAERGGNNGKIQ